MLRGDIIKLQKLGLDLTILFFKTMAMDELNEKDVQAVVGEIKDSILNQVLDTQSTEENIEKTIAAVQSFYQRYNKKWSWVVGPLSKPETLAQHLKRHGLEVTETFASCYFDLGRIITPIDIPNFIIKKVTADDDLVDWAIPLSKAFASSDNAEGFRQLNARLPHGEFDSLQHYVGYFKDKPISCGTLFLSSDAVMIHNIGTDPDFSGRGFGKAMTIHLMLDAKKHGYKHCFLDASKFGLEMYKKLGFEIYSYSDIYMKAVKE